MPETQKNQDTTQPIENKMPVQSDESKHYSNIKHEPIQIIAEFIDPRTAELADIADVKVFIVSIKLGSNYLVQTVCEPERKQIFDELLSPKENELCLRPLDYYIDFEKSTLVRG